jgi:hypothetical protein
MYKREFTAQDFREAAAQQTRELKEMIANLSFWLDGTHHPSEGQNIEYIVRAYLRRRLPKRFEVSTGFISNLKSGESLPTTEIRQVSRQFDILIWDSYVFPALFRADDFVVVSPESVRVIIEVTKTLDSRKTREDLAKFDDLNELYSWDRRRLRPYTAILACSSTSALKKTLQDIEKFYLYHSNLPSAYRYGWIHIQNDESSRANTFGNSRVIPGFISSLCILDKGLIKSQRQSTILANHQKDVVRYYTFPHLDEIEDSFGFFERELIFYLSELASRDSGHYVPLDIDREFNFSNFQKVESSLLIEDWNCTLPTLNTREQSLRRSVTSLAEGSYVANASIFVGTDYSDSTSLVKPDLYIKSDQPTWVIEKYNHKISMAGKYSSNMRSGRWKVFIFNKDNTDRTYVTSYWVNFEEGSVRLKVKKKTELECPASELAVFFEKLCERSSNV